MMPDLMLAMIKLVIVVGIQKTDSGSVIRFEQGGSASLLSTNSDYPYYLKLAERSLERKHPVGVALKGNEVTEFSRADADIVSHLIDNKQKNRLEIGFQGHDGLFSLQHNHPEFARIADTLKISLKEKKQIWFVAKKPLLTLQDAKFLAPPTSPR